MLVKGGLVESRRGVNGGYVLTRRPEDISAAEIIAALDGPVALTACVDGAVGDCNVESLCPLRGGWDRVNAAIRTALESVSLAELYAPVLFPERARSEEHTSELQSLMRTSSAVFRLIQKTQHKP